VELVGTIAPETARADGFVAVWPADVYLDPFGNKLIFSSAVAT
jgi:hypothetical protein